ncbi:MAG: PTS transporter subunit EIIB [Bacilli bacterium]|nr:PTS transporter subunit EIIB [Bacilli bacterium]
MNNAFNLSLSTVDINPNLIIGLIVINSLMLLLVIIMVIRFHIQKSPKVKIDNNEWFMALGGIENIKEINAVGSRLSLNLNDKEAIDREKLKTLGVSSVVSMSNKVTLVIEGKAEKIAETLKQSL